MKKFGTYDNLFNLSIIKNSLNRRKRYKAKMFRYSKYTKEYKFYNFLQLLEKRKVYIISNMLRPLYKES